MLGFEPIAIFGMALGIFVGALAKGISGVALPITALAIALQFVEARTGLALVAMPLLITNIWQAYGAGNILVALKRFRVMGVVFVVSIYAGSVLVRGLDQAVMFGLIGSTAIIFSVSQFWKPSSDPLSPAAERIAGPLAAIVGGVMGGLTSMWGPPIIMFLFMLKLDKDVWVQSISGLYLLGSVPLVLFYFNNGVLNGTTIWLSVAACVPAMAGLLIGERIRPFINEALFRKTLLIALFIVGLNMVRRAIW